MGGLDVDNSELEGPETGAPNLSREYEAAKKAVGLPSESRTGKPGLLSLGRQKGIQGLLSSPVYAARFRLDALANDFLSPLSDLLSKKNYLLTEKTPSSLDCLAFGYLALMLCPSVPQTWLKEAIQARYPRVVKYIWRLREELLGGDGPVKAADVLSLNAYRGNDATLDGTRRKLGMHLPWHPIPTKPLTAVASTIAREVFSGIPLVSLAFRRRTIQPSPFSTSTSNTKPASSLPSSLFVSSFFAFSAALFSAVAGVAIHRARSPRTEDMVFEAPRQQQGLGQAGDFLGVFAEQIRAERDWNTRRQQERRGGDSGLSVGEGMAAVSEVEVEAAR